MVYRRGLHSCGHHLAETLITDDMKVTPVYQAHMELCAACLEMETWQHEQAKKDEETVKKGGFVPRLARLWRAIKIN